MVRSEGHWAVINWVKSSEKSYMTWPRYALLPALGEKKILWSFPWSSSPGSRLYSRGHAWSCYCYKDRVRGLLSAIMLQRCGFMLGSNILVTFSRQEEIVLFCCLEKTCVFVSRSRGALEWHFDSVSQKKQTWIKVHPAILKSTINHLLRDTTTSLWVQGDAI